MNLEISLQALQSVLNNLGWVPKEDNQHQIEYWTPGEDTLLTGNNRSLNEFSLYIPTNLSAPDFRLNFNRALWELSRISQTNIHEAMDLAMRKIELTLDELEIKTETPNISGIVGWDQGFRLFNGTRTIMDAAARTATGNERHFANKASVIAANFLEGCFMGQTRIGSYSVTALIPANQEFSTTNSTKDKISSLLRGRIISNTLATSLEAAKETLEEYISSPNDEIFGWGVSQGLSFELFSGIRETLTHDETEIVIEFRPIPTDNISNQIIRRHFTFDTKYKDAIDQACQVLHRKPASQSVALTGEVTALKRSLSDPNSAQIKLKAIFESKVRTFTVHLSHTDYDKAVDAHKSRMRLSVTGTSEQAVVKNVNSVYITTDPVIENSKHEDENQEVLF